LVAAVAKGMLPADGAGVVGAGYTVPSPGYFVPGAFPLGQELSPTQAQMALPQPPLYPAGDRATDRMEQFERRLKALEQGRSAGEPVKSEKKTKGESHQ